MGHKRSRRANDYVWMGNGDASASKWTWQLQRVEVAVEKASASEIDLLEREQGSATRVACSTKSRLTAGAMSTVGRSRSSGQGAQTDFRSNPVTLHRTLTLALYTSPRYIVQRLHFVTLFTVVSCSVLYLEGAIEQAVQVNKQCN